MHVSNSLGSSYMSKTYEGTVVNGKVELPSDVRLPENSRVLVTVPDDTQSPFGRICTPRLVHREQAKDFTMEVDEAPDAQL